MRHQTIRKWLITAGLVVGLPLLAWAANTKLSSLSSAGAIAGTNRFYCVQSDGSGGVSCIASQIATYINSLFSGDATVNSTGTITLASTGATAASCGDTTHSCSLTVDVKGRITANSNNAISGAGGLPVDYQTTLWYQPLYLGGTASAGSAQVANTIYCGFAPTGATAPTIKTLGGNISGTGGANNAQFAIYSISGNTLTLVDSTGSVSTSATGAVSSAVANTTDALSASTLYAWCTNSSGTPSWTGYPTNGLGGTLTVGSSTFANVANGSTIGKSIAQTFNTWPGTITLSGMTDVTTRLIPYLSFQLN